MNAGWIFRVGFSIQAARVMILVIAPAAYFKA